MYLSVSMYVIVCIWVQMSAESPETDITSECEPFNVGFGNQTQVLY